MPKKQPNGTPHAPRELWLPGAGIRLHALDWGPEDAARVVLLLHGVTGNARIWEPVAGRLSVAFGEGTRIIAIDGRDGGLTDHPAHGYAVADFADDLVRAHDALGGLPLMLVGHSRGGWLAAYFAERQPDRVARLVMVDPARLSFDSAAAVERFYDSVRAGLGPFPSAAAAVEWAMAEDPQAAWNEARRRGFLANFRLQPDGSLIGHFPAAAVDQLRRVPGDDPVGPRLAEISVPTMLMVGANQSAARIANRLAYAAIPGCEVIRLPASHFIHTDLPDETAAAIIGFARSWASGDYS